jgi:CheY-like chemotaxis protein
VTPLTPAKNNKILIVDDEPLNRLFLVDLLKIHNLEPTEATNGMEAIEQWLHNDFFVILMDIQMPKMNGIDTTKIIRQKEQEEGRQKTPIIAVTAYCTKATELDCQSAGMDYYIPKPVNVSELLKVIELFQ